MPQIGPLEILIVAVLALIVFGPERLPEIGRSVGKALNQMKAMASDVKSEFDLSLQEEKEAPVSPSQPVEADAVEPVASDPTDEARVPAARV